MSGLPAPDPRKRVWLNPWGKRWGVCRPPTTDPEMWFALWGCWTDPADTFIWSEP